MDERVTSPAVTGALNGDCGRICGHCKEIRRVRSEV